MEKIDQKEATRLLKISCLTRGEEITGFIKYVRENYGKELVEKIKTRVKSFGFEEELESLGSTKWYPEGLNVLLVCLLKEEANLSDEEIKETGRKVPKFLLVARLYIRYFASITKTFNLASKYWRKFVTCGQLEAYKIDEKAGIAILRLSGYNFRPENCCYLAGYFLATVEMGIKERPITVEETACVFKGDKFHEFTIKWKK